jgi:LuxR family maltose regulon positive regulatory protein
MSSLLATKLHRPSLPPKYVQRPLLMQRLDEGLEADRRVMLVSAPAGFGKTTCVSEWVEKLDMAVTWLSLDDVDDDPGRFFSYLVAALQKVDEYLCLEIEAVLRAGQLPPSEIILSTLINEILDLKSPFLLVIDDFQIIQDDTILQVLTGLVDNLPLPFHLLILTREDPSLPLARLRANNQLTEIRAGDLRFTNPEAYQFLNEVMKLSLSQADITALEERTEGWIVGLHLAGLSVSGRANPSNFIANLSGSHRFILSYLTEEVLNRQPADIQEFLLQTSILERLNGDLCDSITGREDSQVLLERLLNANLFLIPLDDEGHWYRYHQLFGDLLRDRQYTHSGIQTKKLHQRACQWFVQNGMVSEGIQHALDAEDYDTAVHLIESHGMDMLMQWHLKTVEGWMRAIPPEWCAQSPSANLAFAWTHLMRANHTQAFPYLQRLGEIFTDPQVAESIQEEDPTLEAKWLALQSMLLNAQGKSTESVHLCNRALEIAPEDDPSTSLRTSTQVNSMIYLGLANAYQQLDDYDHAVDAFQKLIQLGQTAGNSVSELLGISGLALLALQHGQYHFAFDLVTQGINRIERTGSLPPISTAVYGELAVIHYQWHQLDQAHHYFQRAIQVSKLSGYSDAELFYGVIISRLHQIQGNLEAATQEIQKTVDLMQVEAAAAVQEEVIAQQVRIYLAQSELAKAEMTLKGQGFSFEEIFSYPDPESAHTVPMFSRDRVSRSVWTLYLSALRILLYRAKTYQELTNLKPGLELADFLIEGALKNQYIPFTIEALLLRAQMHAELGNDSSSQLDYALALELGEPEGLISIFVEEGPPIAKALTNLLDQDQPKTDPLVISIRKPYIQKILDAFPTVESLMEVRNEQSDQIEPLTDRELDVLRLMAQGQKYEEIADNLYISLNTVRSHVKAIYGKLGVNNRTKAIDQAHKLQLIS